MQRRIVYTLIAQRNALVRTVLAICLATALGGCRSDELTWTEDVRLPDGRAVTLKRWVEFKGGSSRRGDPATESSQTFEFKHPVTSETIRWKNELPQGRLGLIALWFDKGQASLLTTPLYVGDEFGFNCPNPPYLLYEYVDQQWRSRPLAQIQVNRIRANVTTHPLLTRKMIEASRHHLSADQTADSYTYADGVLKVPYIVKFDGMPAQSFASSNCTRLRNYLISEPGN